MAVRLATCHPDRLHKAYGLCDTCYRRERYNTARPVYWRELLDYLEEHPKTTWAALTQKFGKRQPDMAQVLKWHEHAHWVEVINKNSGVVHKQPYGDKLIKFIESQEHTDWPTLERIFNRTKKQMSDVLRLRDKAYMIAAIDANTKGE